MIVPEQKARGHRHIRQLRSSASVVLDDGDDAGLADALPGQTEHEGIELRLGQRRVRERGSDEAALMKATGAQPDANAVVHQHLEPITAAIAEDVGVVWMGSAEYRHDATERGVGPGSHVHRLDRQPQSVDSDHLRSSRIQVAHSTAALTGQMTEKLVPLR
jgi:hypothetical protein